MSFSVPPPTSPTPAGKPGGDEPKLLSSKDSIEKLFVTNLPRRGSSFNKAEALFIFRILQGKKADWIKLESYGYGLTDGEWVTCIGIRRKDKKIPTFPPAAKSVHSAWIRLDEAGSDLTYYINAAKLIVDFKNAGAEVDEKILSTAEECIKEFEKKQKPSAEPKPKGKRGPKQS